MDEIAAQLGYRPGWPFVARALAMFAGLVLCLNLSQLALWGIFGSAYPALHAAGWGCWFVWQSWLFPNARERYVAVLPDSVRYARAFYVQIWPGVSCGVAQMTAPVAAALVQTPALMPSFAIAGAASAAVGAFLLATGFRTIGIAQAGFLGEYKNGPVTMSRSSIYAVMRHPLFVGGAGLSLGGSLLLGADSTALLVASLNVLLLPVYGWLEDRRLIRVFGAGYARYASAVGGIAPRPAVVLQLARAAAVRARVSRTDAERPWNSGA